MKKYLAVALMFALALFPVTAGATGGAQVTSTTATVGLTYTVGESISVSATPSSGVTFTGTTPSTPNISVTTTWQLATNHAAANVDFFFSSATGALTSGSSNIPASAISLKVDSGSYAPCNANPPSDDPVAVTGATCDSGVNLISAITANPTSSETDTVNLEYNGNPATLAAGSYTGTLNIVAVAK